MEKSPFHLLSHLHFMWFQFMPCLELSCQSCVLMKWNDRWSDRTLKDSLKMALRWNDYIRQLRNNHSRSLSLRAIWNIDVQGRVDRTVKYFKVKFGNNFTRSLMFFILAWIKWGVDSGHWNMKSLSKGYHS